MRLVPSDAADPPAILPVELLPGEPQAPALRVDEPGLLDLVVDGGRFGEAHAGMAESGPADRGAALLANTLVGNPPGTPLVEMTMNGPQLTALRPLVVACAGLGGALEIDGEIAGWQTERIAAGARLRVRGTARGARSYLAVAGGFEVRRVLGSASTDSPRPDRPGADAGDVLGAEADTLPAARLTARPPDRGIPAGRSGSCPARSPTPRRSPRSAPARSRSASATASASASTARPCRAARSCPSRRRWARCRSRPAGVPIILLADRLRTAGYTKPALVHPGRHRPRGAAARRRSGLVRRRCPRRQHGWYLDLT